MMNSGKIGGFDVNTVEAFLKKKYDFMTFVGKVQVAKERAENQPATRDNWENCSAENSFNGHNSIAFYPNIMCILCKEWLCSRNRILHLESHLQYKPYACNLCATSNRKEIVIRQHVKEFHGADGGHVEFVKDEELEQLVRDLAEQSIELTHAHLKAQSEGRETPLMNAEIPEKYQSRLRLIIRNHRRDTRTASETNRVI